MHLLPNLRELQALKPERGWEVSGWAAGGGVRVPQRQPSLAGLFPASPLSAPLLPFLLLGRWAGGGVALVPWFLSPLLLFCFPESHLPYPLALPHPFSLFHSLLSFLVCLILFLSFALIVSALPASLPLFLSFLTRPMLTSNLCSPLSISTLPISNSAFQLVHAPFQHRSCEGLGSSSSLLSPGGSEGA